MALAHGEQVGGRALMDRRGERALQQVGDPAERRITMRTGLPSSLRSRTVAAMLRQLARLETLVPPNLRTRHSVDPR